ncbi:ComEC/Rec2 family competence protein [Jhaorihella thermophila]|uniref:Competence protein ComEC n=1 Tax=Jhaorihella thermophila TaxID=488547 RepID=A0A1H5RSW1_9RHOB|nr:ComEC/Rec2 family competence protein [Jhaorihella thermophila]SEF41204.1 competence protein ComEC [Jhaorihella thermophila]
MRGLAWIDLVLLGQRGNLFPWAPVFLGLGIGIYFLAPQEPSTMTLALLAAGGLGMLFVALRRPGGWSAIGWGLALIAAGVLLATVRAHLVAAPALYWRYYGPAEGRVVGLDRSASDALRVTLDRVRLQDVAPWRTPERVRVSLHAESDAEIRPTPGQRLRITGHLMPPHGPVEPGGFDFRRHAWFRGLGAVGYTTRPVEMLPPARGDPGLPVLRLRMRIAERIRAVLPGETGGVAAAVTTGDRSGIPREALDALRGSNLAHLLAISGLHMGLLAGFVFAAVRGCLAAIPPLALRLPLRKVAACVALLVAAAYLALSGGNVATERAFVMTAVVLGAVLVDRRAFSLRAVAVAALIVLVLRPESLLGPGFQMSFAATTALVSVFGAIRDRGWTLGPRWLRPALAVALSSAVAGLATAPFGAAHFNTLSRYGLPANLLTVPVMGAVVMPAAVLAACLAPFGLESWGLRIMGVGLDWILGVARFVSSLDGAQGHVVAPPPQVLPLLTLGALFVVLWQGRARIAGLVPVAAAGLLWLGAERPQVLVAESGGLVGVQTPGGRALSKARGAGFVARVWLENDGDGARQDNAAARWPDPPGPATPRIRRIDLGGQELVHLIGKRAVRSFGRCRADQIVVTSVPAVIPGGCTVYDVRRLRRTGSLAIDKGEIVAARDVAGRRLWNSPPPRRRRLARADTQ